MRHTFASVDARQGVGLSLTGGMLGHSHASTTQQYAYLADDPLRRTVEKSPAISQQNWKNKTFQSAIFSLRD
jgi:site-specific recombinase XerD